ncbi:carbohydrate kinase family protein [bacterium]|nr:carbohydrate kinase family protein [bacterium]
MHKILIAGSIAFDRIMDFPGTFKEHMVADKAHVLSVSFVLDSMKDNKGGTAANIAHSLALLGEQPILMASVGSDSTAYIEELRKRGIDVSALQICSDVGTATGHIMTDTENNQISAFYPGAMSTVYAAPLPAADLCIVAPTNKVDMLRLARESGEKNIPLFFDPGQMTPALSGDELKQCVEGAAVVLCNDYEWGLIQEKTGWSEKEVLKYATALVITLGAHGSRIVTKQAEETVPALTVAAVDPTGAGDAYRAGFAYGFLRSWPLVRCAQLGSVTASFAVEVYGTQAHTPSRLDIEKRMHAQYRTGLDF